MPLFLRLLAVHNAAAATGTKRISLLSTCGLAMKLSGVSAASPDTSVFHAWHGCSWGHGLGAMQRSFVKKAESRGDWRDCDNLEELLRTVGDQRFRLRRTTMPIPWPSQPSSWPPVGISRQITTT